MSDRRRLLMAIANQFKWLPYYYEYLYNDLVPTTIDSKNVKDKAKVATIYGNSVVENQLCNNLGIPTATVNGVDIINNGDGSYTVNGTASADFVKSLSSVFSRVSGHYYLLCGCPNGGSNSTFRLLESYTYYWTDTGNCSLKQANSSGNTQVSIEVKSGTQINNLVFRPQFIDLTQMFPFDTPTTLTDNRVQALLNRGYIPYNTGEIKSVDIGEIESEGYNLFDVELEVGYLVGGITAPLSYCLRSVNYTSVRPNTNYTFSVESDFRLIRIDEYDENYTYIKENVGGYTNSLDISTSSATKYVKITFANNDGTINYNDIGIPSLTTTQPCLHITGTRTGYAPYVAPQTLQLKYQGSGVGTAHDTMEIGKENVVFTKRMGTVDLGDYTPFEVKPDGRVSYYGIISTPQPGYYAVPNILCSKYLTSTGNAVDNMSSDKIITIGNDYSKPKLYDSTFAGKTAAEVKELLSGVPLQYELATPQVITIPRKRLGLYDFGSALWTKISNIFVSSTQTSGLTILNEIIVYCSKYTYVESTGSYPSIPDKSFTLWKTSESSTWYYISIRDDSLLSKTDSQFREYISGTIMYYKTNSDGADLLANIDIEAGGTLTSHTYTVNLNQLIDTNSIPATQTLSDVTLTNNGDGSFTLSGTSTSYANFDSPSNVATLVVGHKYLQLLVPPDTNRNNIIGISSSMNPSQDKRISTATSTTYSYYIRVESGVTASLTWKPMLIDLTLAFGEGNEPTSIYDPRIYYLINLGYIPYNTTGTKTYVDPNVLPNATFNMKCK